MKLFECGIRYEKTLENGMQKKVTYECHGAEQRRHGGKSTLQPSHLPSRLVGTIELASELVCHRPIKILHFKNKRQCRYR